jgi:glycosyltransferase involved in cell wall biosynthesis
MDKIMVSVVMITYNHENLIARAIEGVVNQVTEYPLELIIGEDCSTDSTRAIVEEYQRKYPEIIRLITSEKNVGAFKNGIRSERACLGKYVAYCEGDDFWHESNKIQLQVNFLENNPDYAVVHSNFDLYCVKTDRRTRSAVNIRYELDDARAFFEVLESKRNICTLTACTRRDLLMHVLDTCPECSDESLMMGDLQRWLELSRLGKVKYFDTSLATYNMLPDSASRGDDQKVLRFALAAKQMRLHYLTKYECPDEVAGPIRYWRTVGVLKTAIRLGNLQVAKSQLDELNSMNMKPLWTWKDYLMYWGCRNALNRYLMRSMRKMWSLTRKVRGKTDVPDYILAGP